MYNTFESTQRNKCKVNHGNRNRMKNCKYLMEWRCFISGERWPFEYSLLQSFRHFQVMTLDLHIQSNRYTFVHPPSFRSKKSGWLKICLTNSAHSQLPCLFFFSSSQYLHQTFQSQYPTWNGQQWFNQIHAYQEPIRIYDIKPIMCNNTEMWISGTHEWHIMLAHTSTCNVYNFTIVVGTIHNILHCFGRSE